MNRTYLRNCIALLACLLCFACSMSPGPEDTIKKFNSLLDEGNVTEAVKLVNVPPGMEGKISMVMSMAATEIKGHGGIASVEIVKSDIQGDVAHIDYTVHYKGGKDGADAKNQHTEHMNLVRSDGKWKINPQ